MEHSIERKQRLTVDGGATIFKQGDKGHEMYVVFSGKVRIFRTQDDHDTDLAVLGPDEFFGEMALFEERPRSATAVAVGETELRVIGKAAFEEMQCDPVVREMLSTMARRLRSMDDAFERLSVEADSRREFMSTRLTQRSWLT